MFFLWLLALSLFEKDFRLRFWHVIVGIIYSTPIFMERLVLSGFIDSLPSWWAILVNGLHILLVIHMLITTLMGRTDDLVEKRRKSRIYLVLMVAFSAISATILGSIFFSQYQPTVHVMSIWPAIVWISFWVSSINEDAFRFGHTKVELSDSLSSRDLELQNRLNKEVIENQCFLENNLSIELLAKRLGVSAYRLRGFINKTLGHTNFSTYINTYRIELIKQTLSNPDNRHIPILTIAMNHGFNSISPFNRAFKQSESMTPKEFRHNLATQTL
ncbi:MAG: helix-turn-helix transcriptional regulator [Kangiellaceae bacterium]|nr:helix-turn-helix transcriptional regulator [Kangiellaceae bacterium]